MFKLFKKSQKTTESTKVQYSEEELEKFNKEINQLLADQEQHLDDADYFEKLGLLYDKVSKKDEAIAHLEKSLSIKLTIGEGYKKLMSLYNQRRKEAAMAHDDELIEYYMSKMDEMRNIAKKVTLTAKED
ncbi:tetratricopeptide repeat protein [Streptococcus dentasini]